MRKCIRHLCVLLAIVMALSGVAALAEPEAEGAALSLQPGDALHGFTVTEVYDSSVLNSRIYTFDHAFSGAKLVYVKNDDPELAFDIGFKTPYIDETDTNHVFEHAIIAASEKYPSKDLFFDIYNRAYQTYVNAHTCSCATDYPVSSLSEAQLMKLMDAYMSCMVAPAILKDERIFQREAIRFELDDPEGDIAINGTVYAEDVGSLTDASEANTVQLADALYPGEVASNSIGMAHHHYRDLTYEHTVETYERCYHFDNSLIFLYGDLNLDRFLSFLDAEYLSKYPAEGTDLSPWKDGLTPSGYVEMQCPVPAYEGDAVENASVITYAIDLDGVSETEINQYKILSSLLNRVGSPLYNARLERGIENPVFSSVYLLGSKNCLMFTMSYANPGQQGELKALVEDALARVASDGIDPEMLEMILKSEELSSKLLRNEGNVGVSLASGFMVEWARSDDANCYRTYEQALRALAADSRQQQIRGMALDLLAPRRSALVTSVPTPGLAEQYDTELAQYLREMKAAMSPEEIEAMVEATAAFNEWNAGEQHNIDFLISPEELPDPTEPGFTKEDVDGVTVYRGETSLEGVGKYSVYFDLSGMSREEMEDLMLSMSYLVQLDTDEHTAAELSLLLGEYTSGITYDLVYPNEATGENHRPMLMLSWCSLTENFEESLDLVLELFTRTNFRDTDMLSYLTAVHAEGWDMSRQDGRSIANMAAHAGAALKADSNRLSLDVSGQDCYYRISDAARRLETEEGFADELAARYETAVQKAYTRDKLIFMTVATADDLDGIVDAALGRLNALPEKSDADAEYTLPKLPKSLAIGVESTLNYSCLVGDYMADAEFTGSYLPFVYALSDLYTIPTFRFRLGAYGGGSVHQWAQGCLMTQVYSDPNVSKTVEALRAIPEALKAMELTDELLDGYILKAYAQATRPLGALETVMNAMNYDLLGMDAGRVLAIKSDIRNAKLDQLDEAAEHIGKIVEDSALCMVGNEALLRADADCFDEVISYRHND